MLSLFTDVLSDVALSGLLNEGEVAEAPGRELREAGDAHSRAKGIHFYLLEF